MAQLNVDRHRTAGRRSGVGCDSRSRSATRGRSVLLANRGRLRYRDDAGSVVEHRQWDDGTILDWPRRLHGIGGYTAGLITYYGSLCLWNSAGRHGGFLGPGEWIFAGSCLIGGLVAAGTGFVVGLPSLRVKGDYLAIMTLGFGEILRVLLQQTNEVLDDWQAVRSARLDQLFPPPVGGAVGFNGIPKYTSLFWVYSFLAITVVAAFRLKRSSMGRAMMSVREDEIAAQAMGVNVTRQKVRAFVLSALLAGIAGGLFAHERGIIVSPKDAGFQRSFDYVLMTVLGGRGSITGVMLAATLLTSLPELLRGFEQYRLVVFALLLIVMMVVRPQGLFGVHEIWELGPLRRWFGAGSSKASRSAAAAKDSSIPTAAATNAAVGPLLDVEQVSISFGGLKALVGFSLKLPQRALYGLIGPNGAGKTTVFNLLTGIYQPDRGQVRLDAHALVGRPPHEITACGMARTFQNIRLFGGLNVLDNVRTSPRRCDTAAALCRRCCARPATASKKTLLFASRMSCSVCSRWRTGRSIPRRT